MNILLIQMLRLGDALQMVPIIRGLKTHFPGCSICVLTSSVGRWVFERDPAVDAVHVLDKQKIATLVARSTKKDIRSALALINSELGPLLSAHWDWVINFSFSYPSALLCFLLDADRRSGYVVNGQRQFLSKERWFAHSLASFTNRRYSNFNWVDINREIIGLPSVPRHPLVRPSIEAVEKASLHLRSIGFEGKRVVGMNPGASGAYKMWPVEKFGLLGRSLVEKHDIRILVFGGKEETGLGRALKRFIGDRAEDLSGRTNLDELAAFLSFCDALVTNDTGPMHLAYSVGTRVISLFFNSHFVETGPYGKGHVAVHPDIPCFPCQGPAKCENKECLSYISPETVERILLNGTGPDPGYPRPGTGDRDSVQVHVSDFDPSGVLEWFPLYRPPLSMPVLERILLRAAWLYHCGKIPGDGAVAFDDLDRELQRYSSAESREEIALRLGDLREGLLAFREGVERAHAYASQIHIESAGPKPDVTRISSLGVKLGAAEKEALTLEKNSSLSLVAELLKVFLENIELSSLTDLSRSTMAAYCEIIQFTDLVMAGAEKVKDRLLHEGKGTCR